MTRFRNASAMIFDLQLVRMCRNNEPVSDRSPTARVQLKSLLIVDDNYLVAFENTLRVDFSLLRTLSALFHRVNIGKTSVNRQVEKLTNRKLTFRDLLFVIGRVEKIKQLRRQVDSVRLPSRET